MLVHPQNSKQSQSFAIPNGTSKNMDNKHVITKHQLPHMLL